MALHHIIKKRGHFLFQGQSIEEARDIKNIYSELKSLLAEEYENDFLSYIIYPKIKEMKNNNKFTFFFVRYKDNRSDHLRLRFHFLEDRFISAILNLCKEIKSSGYEISYELRISLCLP